MDENSTLNDKKFPLLSELPDHHLTIEGNKVQYHDEPLLRSNPNRFVLYFTFINQF